MEDRPDHIGPKHVGMAVNENLADRPDYAGSLGNRHYDKATYSNSVGDTIEAQRDRFIEQITGHKASQAVPPPIKVFTVCVDPENGKYLAFLGSDPAKKATGPTRNDAVYALLVGSKIITETEID